MKMNELRAEAKELGINSFGKKKVDLEKLIKEAKTPKPAAPEDIPEETPVKKAPKPAKVSQDVKENFIPATALAQYEARGFKKSELDSQAGFSLPADVKHIYIREVKKGSLIYVRR